jgi:hypothetical protein
MPVIYQQQNGTSLIQSKFSPVSSLKHNGFKPIIIKSTELEKCIPAGHILSKLVPCYFAHHTDLHVHPLLPQSVVKKLITMDTTFCCA